MQLSENLKHIFILFFGVPHFFNCIFLIFSTMNQTWGKIDPGMALTPFQCSNLDETRFKPTTF